MAPVALSPADPDLLGHARLAARALPTPTTSTDHVLRTAARALMALVRRDTIAIPAHYAGLNAGPPPGNVAGIVLGAVAGCLLLMWLLYTCFNIGRTPPRSSVEEIGVEVLQRPSGTARSSDRERRRRSRSRSEVIEVRSPPRPRRERERVRETIVMEETTRRSSPPREEEDIVEVIEEHSPPPRRHSRRVSSSGYRNVDPDEFAGGDRPLRKVRH